MSRSEFSASVRWRRAGLAVVPLNATELLATASGLVGAQAVSAQAPVLASVLVAGVEIASVPAASDRALRRTWRERRGSGATPLLLVADDPTRPGSLLALGVADASGPLRTVEASALADVLARVASRPRLEAVRELASELDRLDQAGVPGLRLRDLLTIHTLDVRLRGDVPAWARARESVKDIPRGAEWRAVLQKLGYQLERRPHRGFLARAEGRPVAVVHPKADPAEFARLDPEGRPPEGVLLNDCRADGAEFGILASGSRLRLFEVDAPVGASAARYLDLDAGALQDDDLAFLALLSPEYLAAGRFRALEGEALHYGARLRRRLDDTVRQMALPTLGRALGRWSRSVGQDPTDDHVRAELERAALTLVFRALFLLYAESARHLPMDHPAYERASATALVDEAVESADRLGARSTSLWDRFNLLVKAMRTGNPAWGVPAYNGSLFAPDGFEGAATLERATISDPDFATVLMGLGRDRESGTGIDYSTLEIGHLGHIYEGLLSLRLSAADIALRYDATSDRYVPAAHGEQVDVEPGDLLWQTNQGGRKGGGVYYTRSELVRHLVRQAVVPAFGAHLEEVRARAVTDPGGAALDLFDFAVLDPACGSAHFLVVVVNELADLVVRFLAETPLPEVAHALERLRAGAAPGAHVDDVALLRRLVLKRCVYGVDVSPMGAEVAKLSLWLASFVPGLSLAYLDRNVIVGNSLVGVARPEALLWSADGAVSWLDEALSGALAGAAEAAARVAQGDDRNPDEVEASGAADRETVAATAGLARLFDLWTAEPFGVAGGRQEASLHGAAVIEGRTNGLVESARQQSALHRFLHWPLAFPGVFSRPRPGFDAVVGNPPWDEVTVEELAFYGLFRPGLRSQPEGERAAAIARLREDRPDLPQRLDAARHRALTQRAYLAAGEYASMAGDPDLYKFFCQRYRSVLRDGGALGVVLPRSTFITEGSAGFRHWLFEEITAQRVDFLLNSGRWAFDSEPRYTVALVAAERTPPPGGHLVRLAGTATSLAEWEAQIVAPGLALAPEAFGPDWAPPLIRSQVEADVLAKLRSGSPFPNGSGSRWQCFPVAELHETNDRPLWQSAAEGRPLWKGESFDQYDPHGVEARLCPDSEALRRKTEKPRPGAQSMLAATVSLATRRRAVLDELGRSRVAFRDVSRATDSRTVRSCLVPPGVLLTNKAPYLAFVDDDDTARTACLGILNSLPFDWQARRFVETNLNYFILEGLVVPDLSDEDFEAIADAAARLSCVDERFVDFAEGFGLTPNPLPEEERERLRVEIDARVARAWQLTDSDLEVLFADFTLGAVPLSYRQRLRARLAELS